MKQLASIIILALAASASIAGSVKVRQKPGFDFSVLHTYSFAWEVYPDRFRNHPVADGDPVDPSVERAVDKVLEAKGFERVSSGQPDFLVNCTGFVEDRLTVEGEERRIAEGVSWIGEGAGESGRPSQIAHHRIEILDPTGEEVLWSAWDIQVARDDLARKRKLEKWTRKIIRHFPPR